MSHHHHNRTGKETVAVTRQATILRRNLMEWDAMLHNRSGEDWPTMLGRLNAAMNQTILLDQGIEDVMEHFVYLPRKSPANPQDIPFFLSTRLEVPVLVVEDSTATSAAGETTFASSKAPEDPVQQLYDYETTTAQIAKKFEDSMVRF